MSETETVQETQHAMLVVWGQYAHCLGIPQEFAKVPMSQKTVDHSPQGKVLEFLVAHLAGLPYLKDISRAATPLDQDAAVAQAWEQPSWADYSGVSRTLSALTEAEATQYMTVLDQVTQTLLDGAVQRALTTGRLVLDGDLSPRPVSNSSHTYPEASYGYMDGQLQLGYQAAVISLSSPTYGRLGLSATRHTGKTVSVTQAEALVLAAERRLGRRPWRRTDLLAQRLTHRAPELAHRQQMVATATQQLTAAEAQLLPWHEDHAARQTELRQVETDYTARQCPERPHSHLAQVRRQTDRAAKRLARQQQIMTRAQAWLQQQQQRLTAWETETAALSARLHQLEAENAANPHPLPSTLRLDAGFGSASNLAWLIEMGYEIYTKPYGTWLAGVGAQLRREHADAWQPVGKNADMLAWAAVTVAECPYPLDLGYTRYWHGEKDGQAQWTYSGWVHFGLPAVTTDLPGWFHFYNARQTLEAGNKEAQQVFEVQHIKVRSLPAMRLQEYLALFCANFVRFAAHWLAEQCTQVPTGWQVSTSPRVKEQVKVGAHAPAYVYWYGKDCLVRFKECSVYARQSLLVKRQIAIQLTLRL